MSCKKTENNGNYILLYAAYIYLISNQFLFTCTRFADWGGQYGLFDVFAHVMEFVLLDYAIWEIIKEPDRKIKLVLGIITLCGALCDGDEVRTLCLMLVALYGQPMKRVLKIWLITISSLFALTIFSSLVGILEFRINLGDRYEFGMIWYTDFAYTCLFLLMAYGVLRNGRFRLPEYPALYLFTLLIFKITRAKNTIICMLCFITLCFFTYIFGKALTEERRQKAGKWLRSLQKYVLDYAYIWGLLLFFLVLSVKDIIIELAKTHYGLGSYADRLRFSAEALGFPVTLFGQYFYEGHDPYFMLDQFYPRLFVRHGAVLFVIVLAVLTYIMKKARKEGNTIVYWVMLTMALFSQTDPQVIDCSRDFMFPLAFTVWGAASAACVERAEQNGEEKNGIPVCRIMGVGVAAINMDKLISYTERNLDKLSGKYYCVTNVHATVMASENPEYMKAQERSELSMPDGAPLAAYGKSKGYSEMKRTTGPTFMEKMLERSPEKGYRHYFYGSTEDTLEKLKEKLREKYPGLQIAGMYSPPFRELTSEEDADITRMINEAEPDFIWVGLGAPKQELWMMAHKDKVKGLMVGVGAAFDFHAGKIDRAPGWMQRHSLEWLYRLLQDPKRLAGRYLVTNTKYLLWRFFHAS